jgi:hypothetical protein
LKKIRIGISGRTQDYPAGPGSQIILNICQVTNSPADLNRNGTGLQDSKYDFLIVRDPLPGAVQVDEMKKPGSLGNPTAGDFHRIFGVYRLLPIIALEEPDTLAAADVNGRNNQHEKFLKGDGFVKSPSAALRFNFVVAAYLYVRFTPQFLRA